MIYRIARGKHRADGCFLPRFSDGTEAFRFSFSESCLYAPDQEQDLNKLCGVSYGFLPRLHDGKLIPAHHWDSLRLTWRAVPAKRAFEVWAYEYDLGVRRMTYLFDAAVGEDYWAVFRSIQDRRAITVIEEGCMKVADWIGHSPVSRGYVLGLYFGGNDPAPHSMYLDLERL